MDLDFLDKKEQNTNATTPAVLPGIQKVSSGNSEAGNQKAVLTFDPTRATLEHNFALPTDRPYLQRAIEYAASHNWITVPTLKEALERRQQIAVNPVSANHPLPAFALALSFHEADTAYRAKIDLSNQFFQQAIKEFGGIITEEDSRYMTGVLVLRARFNKGLDWKKNKRPNCDVHSQEKGDKMLQEIVDNLAKLSMPLHVEELEEGVHKEFLKPEWLDWGQFQREITEAQKMRTIAERQELELLRSQVAA